MDKSSNPYTKKDGLLAQGDQQRPVTVHKDTPLASLTFNQRAYNHMRNTMSPERAQTYRDTNATNINNQLEPKQASQEDTRKNLGSMSYTKNGTVNFRSLERVQPKDGGLMGGMQESDVDIVHSNREILADLLIRGAGYFQQYDRQETIEAISFWNKDTNILVGYIKQNKKVFILQEAYQAESILYEDHEITDFNTIPGLAFQAVPQEDALLGFDYTPPLKKATLDIPVYDLEEKLISSTDIPYNHLAGFYDRQDQSVSILDSNREIVAHFTGVGANHQRYTRFPPTNEGVRFYDNDTSILVTYHKSDKSISIVNGEDQEIPVYTLEHNFTSLPIPPNQLAGFYDKRDQSVSILDSNRRTVARFTGVGTDDQRYTRFLSTNEAVRFYDNDTNILVTYYKLDRSISVHNTNKSEQIPIYDLHQEHLSSKPIPPNQFAAVYDRRHQLVSILDSNRRTVARFPNIGTYTLKPEVHTNRTNYDIMIAWEKEARSQTRPPSRNHDWGVYARMNTRLKQLQDAKQDFTAADYTLLHLTKMHEKLRNIAADEINPQDKQKKLQSLVAIGSSLDSITEQGTWGKEEEEKYKNTLKELARFYEQKFTDDLDGRRTLSRDELAEHGIDGIYDWRDPDTRIRGYGVAFFNSNDRTLHLAESYRVLHDSIFDNFGVDISEMTLRDIGKAKTTKTPKLGTAKGLYRIHLGVAEDIAQIYDQTWEV